VCVVVHACVYVYAGKCVCMCVCVCVCVCAHWLGKKKKKLKVTKNRVGYTALQKLITNVADEQPLKFSPSDSRPTGKCHLVISHEQSHKINFFDRQ